MEASKKTETTEKFPPSNLPLGEWDKPDDWDDFVLAEKGKPHTPESLRALKSGHEYIPDSVFERIAIGCGLAIGVPA